MAAEGSMVGLAEVLVVAGRALAVGLVVVLVEV
jgi:hypothetical protein